MLTDEMLREAAVDMEQLLLSAVPGEDESHVFSERFERKMSRLIRRAEHPVIYQVLRAAAAIVLVITTLFGAMMAASSEVRAGVLDWIKITSSGTIFYKNESTNTKEDLPAVEYRLPAVPEGYEEYGVMEGTYNKHYSYVRKDQKMLVLISCYAHPAGGIYLWTDNHIYHSGYEVNGVQAEIYTSPDGKGANYIIWQDPETEVLLIIQAFEEPETLVALAETVERIDK